jgi:selenophosphate synthase
VTYARPVADWQETLLHDPQTSGGLLVATANAEMFMAYCAERGQFAALIGEVVEGSGIEIA